MDKILHTERLTLRPLCLDDWQAVHEYAADRENAKYMAYLPNETVEDTKQFLTNVSNDWKKEEQQNFEFAIILDTKLIGAVSITLLDKEHTEAEFGWIINKRYWKNGYAVEAALAVKEFAINELKVSRLIAHCDSRNTGSYRTMEKIGLKLEDDTGVRYNRGSTEPAKELRYALDFDVT